MKPSTTLRVLQCPVCNWKLFVPRTAAAHLIENMRDGKRYCHRHTPIAEQPLVDSTEPSISSWCE